MAFIVDASMALTWHFDDEHSPATEAVFARTVTEAIVVPSHWASEIANGVLVGERRGRAVPAQLEPLLERIDKMEIEIDDADRSIVFSVVLPLARRLGLTVYDALYLELAKRRGLPLATLDKDLAAAARCELVHVIGVA